MRVWRLRDVDNPLLGERGAARVFGPQKGATPAVVERLERGLEHLAAAIERDLGIAVRLRPGGGSAGGAAIGAVAFLGARLVPGARLVCDWRASTRACAGRHRDHRRRAPRLAVARRQGGVGGGARRRPRGVPVAVVAGRVAIDPAIAFDHGIHDVEASASAEVTDAEALGNAAPLLEAAATRLVKRLATRVERVR